MHSDGSKPILLMVLPYSSTSVFCLTSRCFVLFASLRIINVTGSATLHYLVSNDDWHMRFQDSSRLQIFLDFFLDTRGILVKGFQNASNFWGSLLEFFIAM